MQDHRPLKIVATEGYVTYSATFPVGAEAERDEFLALFPKSAGLRRSNLSAWEGSIDGVAWERDLASVTYPLLKGDVVLVSNGVNGGVNETGLRRIRTIVRIAKREGISIDYQTPYSNSLSGSEFEALVAEPVR